MFKLMISSVEVNPFKKFIFLKKALVSQLPWWRSG